MSNHIKNYINIWNSKTNLNPNPNLKINLSDIDNLSDIRTYYAFTNGIYTYLLDIFNNYKISPSSVSNIKLKTLITKPLLITMFDEFKYSYRITGKNISDDLENIVLDIMLIYPFGIAINKLYLKYSPDIDNILNNIQINPYDINQQLNLSDQNKLSELNFYDIYQIDQIDQTTDYVQTTVSIPTTDYVQTTVSIPTTDYVQITDYVLRKISENLIISKIL